MLPIGDRFRQDLQKINELVNQIHSEEPVLDVDLRVGALMRQGLELMTELKQCDRHTLLENAADISRWQEGLHHLFVAVDDTDIERVGPVSHVSHGVLHELDALFGELSVHYLGLETPELEQVCLAKRLLDVDGGQLEVPGGGETANGVFFLSDPNTKKKAFVVKPVQQEAGMPGNPQGMNLPRSGFMAGGGAVRERFCYQLQEALGVDFGIPFTELVETGRPELSEAAGLCPYICRQLESEFGFDFTTVDPDPREARSAEDLADYLSGMGLEGTQAAVGKMFESILEAEKAGTKFSLPKIATQTREAGITDPTLRLQVLTLAKLFRNLLGESLAPPLVSVQAFRSGNHHGAYLAKDALSEMPIREMQKCIFDLITFNTDRHMNNLLFHGEDVPETMTLIDHGLCLPDPDSLQRLDEASYHWRSLPQFTHPLVSPYKEVFRDLDVSRLLEKLRAKQVLLDLRYPDFGRIPEGVYSLLQTNLLMLKVAASHDIPLIRLVDFHLATRQTSGELSGGRFAEFFHENVQGVDNLDWEPVMNLLLEELR